MQKTVKIRENEFNLCATGGMLCLYKEQFGTEYYDDFLRLNDIKNNMNASETEKLAVTVEVGFRLVWSMAKAADQSIGDPDMWFAGYEEFPLIELMTAAMELLGKVFAQAVSDGGKSGSRLTSENLAACCIACGMNMQDINSLGIGFLLNSINEFIKIKSGGKSVKNAKRKATQADFDAF